jgi:purine-binding chemotaxis protein CheW
MSALKDRSLAGEYLIFTLGGESCAMTIRRVLEVIEYQPSTAVPNAPPTIRGVINLRGKVVPIVDLAAKFGFAPGPVTKWTCLIVVEALLDDARTPLAIVADTVDDVALFNDQDLAAPPSFGTRVRLEYLLALGRFGGKFALIFDVDRLLTFDELLSVAPPPGLADAPHE